MLIVRKSSTGFTLVEMIAVIVITAILATSVAIFLQWPVQEYVDSARRAGLNYTADAAFREMARHIRTAVPNTVRIWGATNGYNSCNGTEICYLEYLETIAGGRYNSETSTDCFNSSVSGVNCTSLTSTGTINPVNGGTITTGTSLLVVDNPYNSSGGDCSYSKPSAYCSSASATSGVAPVITSYGATSIGFASYTFLPTPTEGSPGNRYQIVSWPVTYVCSPSPSIPHGGTLTRYWNYTIQPAQPYSTTSTPLSTASSAVLATNVVACKFYLRALTRTNTLTTTDLAPTELVILNSTIVDAESSVSQSCNSSTEPCEGVGLYEEVKVTNVP